MKFLPAFFASLILAAQAFAADVSVPVVSDSRVKTFVYNENEVYPILTQFGYQTNIEFGRSEEIQTISVGDRVSWQVIPAGQRIFIQTMLENARTNMTVVTDKHSYQFDLQSTSQIRGNEDRLVYVARFYYPDEDWDTPEPVREPDSLTQQSPAVDQYNFDYTYSGPEMIAPVKIFDDGTSTFFQFKGGAAPAVFAVTPDGMEMPVQASPHNGYYVVQSTAPQFALRQGSDVVCVFNEQIRGR